MSSSHPLSRTDPVGSIGISHRRSYLASLPGWLREPFLHFLVLGGILFLADHLLIKRADDPRTILVGRDVDSEAVEVFKSSRGREPNSDELAALHRIWIDNEVLYREGLALQVDRGDDAIRERVIFKALSVIDANVKLPDIDDVALHAWFEQHRARYDDPPRFDFEEAILSGDTSESAVRGFVDRINAAAAGEAGSGLRVFKGRPESNLLQSYGAEFTSQLAKARPGEWRALEGRDGWRAIRLTALAAPVPASYESLRGVVLQDWKDATAAEQRSAAVRTLARKYTIRFEPVPAHGDE